MAICIKCGKSVGKGLRFCPSCGTAMKGGSSAPVQHRVSASGSQSVLSTVEWLITMLVLSIPLVGLIMLFVWAFGRRGNLNRRNLCRASLIVMAAAIVLSIVIGLLSRSLFQSFVNPYLELIRGFI